MLIFLTLEVEKSEKSKSMKMVLSAGKYRLDAPNNPQKELGQSGDVRADADEYKS